MSNCQGLSFIRGHLYAVGNGPKGTGLYRLDDPDGDGVFDTTELDPRLERRHGRARPARGGPRARTAGSTTTTATTPT